MTREDITECLAKDPALVPIVVRVLHAAGMSGHDEILDALGAGLGEALLHPENASEVELIIMGLERLRPEHVRVLEVLGSPPLQSDGAAEENPWNDITIGERLGWDRHRAFTAGVGLVNAGFALSLFVWTDRSALQITPLGQSLLQVLETYRGVR